MNRTLRYAAALIALLMTSIPAAQAAESLLDKLKKLGSNDTAAAGQNDAGPLKLGALADPAVSIETVTARLRERQGLPPGFSVYASRVPGLFVVASPPDLADPLVCPVYVDADVRVIANARDRGWAQFGTLARLNEPMLSEIRRGIAHGLAATGVRVGSTSQQPFMIEYTANDCPACIEMDKLIRQQYPSVSYATIGTWLQGSNAQVSHDAWCASDADAAWSTLMLQRKMPPRTQGACGRLVEARRTLACAFAPTLPGGNIPQVIPVAIMPDGSVVSGTRPILDLLAKTGGNPQTFSLAAATAPAMMSSAGSASGMIAASATPGAGTGRLTEVVDGGKTYVRINTVVDAQIACAGLPRSDDKLPVETYAALTSAAYATERDVFRRKDMLAGIQAEYDATMSRVGKAKYFVLDSVTRNAKGMPDFAVPPKALRTYDPNAGGFPVTRLWVGQGTQPAKVHESLQGCSLSYENREPASLYVPSTEDEARQLNQRMLQINGIRHGTGFGTRMYIEITGKINEVGMRSFYRAKILKMELLHNDQIYFTMQ